MKLSSCVLTLLPACLASMVTTVMAQERDLQTVRDTPVCNMIERFFESDVSCVCDQNILDQELGFDCEYDVPLCTESIVSDDGDETARLCLTPTYTSSLLLQPLAGIVRSNLEICFNDMTLQYSPSDKNDSEKSAYDDSKSSSYDDSKDSGKRKKKQYEDDREDVDREDADLGSVCASLGIQAVDGTLSGTGCALSFDGYGCGSCGACTTVGGNVGIQFNCDNFARDLCLPIPIPGMIGRLQRSPLGLPRYIFPEFPDDNDDVARDDDGNDDDDGGDDDEDDDEPGKGKKKKKKTGKGSRRLNAIN